MGCPCNFDSDRIFDEQTPAVNVLSNDTLSRITHHQHRRQHRPSGRTS